MYNQHTIPGIYKFTNHSVNQLQMTEGFNENHIAKCLVGHCETYKYIIDKLLELG